MKIALHIRYWLPIPALLIGAWLYDARLAVPFHETYFVGHRLDMSIILSLVLFLSGLGYAVLKREPNKFLKRLHGWLTVTGFLLAIFMYLAQMQLNSQRASGALDYNYIVQSDQILTIEIIAIGLILLGFTLYVNNIVQTFLKP